MNKHDIVEHMLDSDSLRETILEFVEGGLDPYGLYNSLFTIKCNVMAAMAEPEGLDGPKEFG